MLLRFALLALISVLMAGVLGFEGTLPSFPIAAAWGRTLFLPFLAIAIAGLIGGTMISNSNADHLEHQSQSRNHRSFSSDASQADADHRNVQAGPFRVGDTCRRDSMRFAEELTH